MSHIDAYVLKSFPYSEDGISSKIQHAGETFPCRAELFDGLNNERFVRRAEIGDGHFALNGQKAPKVWPELPADFDIRTVASAPIIALEGETSYVRHDWPESFWAPMTLLLHPMSFLNIEDNKFKFELLNGTAVYDFVGIREDIGYLTKVESSYAPMQPKMQEAPAIEPDTGSAPAENASGEAAPIVVAAATPAATPPAAAAETVAAPQPASRTAALTEAEEAALADGSWKTMKFFAQRSIAAKLSSDPVPDGATAVAVIEAELAKRAAVTSTTTASAAAAEPQL